MSPPLSSRSWQGRRRERRWEGPSIRVRARSVRPMRGLESGSSGSMRHALGSAWLRDAPPSEWGSLLGDLSRPARGGAGGDERRAECQVAWQVHDRTHLELAVDYPFEKGPATYAWEVYFFVPESFRLAQTTYDKKQIYDDLLSYVRLAVPELTLAELAAACDPDDAGSLAGDLRAQMIAAEGEADGSAVSKQLVRRLRVLACLVRGAGLSGQRAMLAEIERARDSEQALRAAQSFLTLAARATGGVHSLVTEAEGLDLPGEALVALRWADEDISLFIEALAAAASVEVQRRSPPDAPRPERPLSSEVRVPPAADPRSEGEDEGWAEVAGRLAAGAVAEARYRKGREYASVGREDATAREVEHIEFRRHVLKRFTSSVLWLRYDVRDAATWVLHVLYAIAAAFAMVFAAIATIRVTQLQTYVTLYVVLLVAAYAVKDRMKAMLQSAFARWAQKRFADRAWTIRDEERKGSVGIVKERAGFRDFARLPDGVLRARRVTREHALEEHARPETVLWHQKTVRLGPRIEGRLPSPAMTEIFRLNIGSWLAHTDDPNRTLTFADPDAAAVCSVTARRVYNINVVYRVRRLDDHSGDPEAGWQRIRLVVSRKGIERIEPIPVY